MSISSPSPSPLRAIALLSLAAFASQAMVRVSDSLLPQIAADLAVTIGAASIIVTAYGLAHGTAQLFGGSIGNRFGKYRACAALTGISAIVTFLCGLADSLTTLVAIRLACGLGAGCIIPLAMAYVGDVIPYERRQQVLGRFLTGQISGLLFGQVAGGVLGDLFGWRNVFFLLAGLFALAAIALAYELSVNPLTRAAAPAQRKGGGLIADYAAVFRTPWARVIIVCVFIESALFYGSFAYIGADLHVRFGVGFTLVGLVVGCFAIGGLLYTAMVAILVNRLGQVGLAAGGGCFAALGFFTLALQPVWWLAPPAVVAIGLGFYMVHNTLQTNATQMTPQARGTAVAIFSSSIYMGLTAGVALAALVVDRFTATPVFAVSGIFFPLLAIAFALLLRRQRRIEHEQTKKT